MGVANLVETLEPLTRKEFTCTIRRHGVPADQQIRVFRNNWRVPWVLSEARGLTNPVCFSHPRGAVVWVKLGRGVAKRVREQL